MKIVIVRMNERGESNREVIEGENITNVEVEGFEMNDDDGGLRIRSKDILRITPSAANSIIIKSSRKW